MGPKELLSLDRRARRLHRFGVTLAAFGSLSLVASTLVLANGIAHLVENESVVADLIGLGLLIIIRIAARSTSAHLLSTSSARIRSTLRASLIGTWIAESGSATRSLSTGEDSTLLGSGIDSLDDYITAFLPARSLGASIPVVVFVIIGILDPWTLLILLFAGPMLILLLAIIGGRTKALADRRFRELGWLRSFYLDMIRGLPALKVFGRAEESTDTIEDISDRFGRTTMDVLRTAFQTSLVIEWAATAATALVAVQVSFRMIDGDMRYGAALAVLMLTPEFFAPLRNLAIEYHAGQTGAAVLSQVPDLVPATQKIPPTPTSRVRTSFETIRFEAVGFTYPNTSNPAVHDLSLALVPGETVAIIGPSGTGKSTILKLFSGRLSPTVGEIKVDGEALGRIPSPDWLNTITSVPQDPFLFRATVRDNLLIAKRGANDDEIRDALVRARANDFVTALPSGLSTVIGEDGGTLSGGQRQRLALARALLRDAPIVLLDEFTAHLDPETEMDVIESIRPFLANRTVVMVAHRSATLSLADRIIEIGDNVMIEQDR